MNDRNLKFRGEVLSIEKTAETRKDEHGETWSNCIFTVKLTDSNSVTKETVGRQWIGKTIRLKRWCCYRWHYKTHVRITIGNEELSAL
jgi:hypothetical protein